MTNPPEKDQARSNKDIIRRLLAEMDRGNLDAIDLCYAPDYVDHSPSVIRGQKGGREGVRNALGLLHRAFPDTRHTIEELIAEGDRVAARITARGTHTGELLGHAPTGRVVTQTSITIYRIVDGRIAERWSDHPQEILEQLGLSEPEGRPGSR